MKRRIILDILPPLDEIVYVYINASRYPANRNILANRNLSVSILAQKHLRSLENLCCTATSPHGWSAVPAKGDPRLTANLYTDMTQLPTFDAVESLPWHSEGCPHIGPHEAVSACPSASQDVTDFVSIYDPEALKIEQDMNNFAYPVTSSQNGQADRI